MTEIYLEDNFTRAGLVIVNEVQEVLREIFDYHTPDTFMKLIIDNKHILYHYFNKTCCDKNCSLKKGKKRLLNKGQMNVLFEVSTAHEEVNLKYCCASVKNITTKDVDISLMNVLLDILLKHVFWRSCLDEQGLALKDLLNKFKHTLYHLYDRKTVCCECTVPKVKSVPDKQLKKDDWDNLFSIQNNSQYACKNKNNNTCICNFEAEEINIEELNNLQDIVLSSCCPLRQSLDHLVRIRNEVYGHAPNGTMVEQKFLDVKSSIEDGVRGIISHGIFDSEKKSEILEKFNMKLKERWDQQLTQATKDQLRNHLIQQWKNDGEILEEVKRVTEASEELQGNQSTMMTNQSKMMAMQSTTITNDATLMTNQSKILTELSTITELLSTKTSHVASSVDHIEVDDIGIDAVPYVDDDVGPTMPHTEDNGTDTVPNVDDDVKTIMPNKEEFKYHALIHHTENDEKDVEKLKELLLKHNPDLHLATTEDIPPGQPLLRGFSTLMGNCKFLVLFITEEFLNEGLEIFRVNMKLVDNLKKNKFERVIPVLFHDKSLKSRLPPELTPLQHILYYADENNAKCKKFLEHLNTILSDPLP